MKAALEILLTALALLLVACIEPQKQTATESQPRLVKFNRPGIPVVDIRILVKSGSADDPVGKDGLARFTSKLMLRGTERFNRDSINNRLQLLGTELDVNVDRETILFRCKTLRENLDQSYELLSDILLHPSFTTLEAERTRTEQLDEIDNIIEDDGRLALCAFQSILYSGHRYSHPVEGILSAVKSLSATDAESFYRSNFKSDNIIIGIAGDYPDGFARKAQSDIASLPAGFKKLDRGTATPVPARKVVLVEKENRTQNHFRIGNIVTYDRTNADYYPLIVANAYLGQHRESFGRLYQTIRTERGLAYGAYSYLEHFEQAGWSKLPSSLIPWMPTYRSIWTYPKSINTEFAIKLAMLELSKLADGCLDSASFDKSRLFATNHFAFQHETIAQRMELRMEELLFGNSGYVDGYAPRIESVTQSEAVDAVRRNWLTDRFLLVAVVSDAEAFKVSLLDSVTTIEYPSGATSAGQEEVDQAVKAFDLGLTESDFTIVKAAELFE
jgi:zinc protease